MKRVISRHYEALKQHHDLAMREVPKDFNMP